MDEVLRELEVGNALSLLCAESCQMSTSALFPLCFASAGDPGGFVCCSGLGWEGGGGNHHKSSHCPRQSLKEPQQIQLLL